MKLLIASRNVHKIRECKALLRQLPNLDIISLLDFPNYVPPEETGRTFEENALLKATHAASALDCYALADDSGLVIPALGGAPGVYSARYAGLTAGDADNRKKLLQEMRSLPEQQRSGYFECCLALASPQGIKKIACARCEGTIATEEKGNKGFGYDSLFIKHEYSKTFGELDEATKNRVSHRRKALDRILLTLEQL